MNSVLIFDGDCAFCSSSVRVAQRWIRRLPEAVPYQFADLGSLGLTETECASAVQYVRPGATPLAAERAVAAVLVDAGRGWWLLGRLLQFPIVRPLAGVVYRWVARNRHRLPGGTAACALRPPVSPDRAAR